MQLFVDSPTELSTAATDAFLAIMAVVCLAGLHFTRPRSFRLSLWQALFATFAFGALLGAIVHAVRMPLSVNDLLWHPIYFLLGLVLTLLAIIAVHDSLGESAARRWSLRLLPLPLLVVVVTWLGEGEFIYFVLFEAAVMLSALGIYSRLTLKRMPGAAAILAGLLISTVAAILQACGPYYFTFVWTFDHNGLYHLVQMPGLLLFYLGAGAVAGQAAVDDRRE